MFVISSNEEILKKVTLFYSGVTSLILSSLIAALWLSQSYLFLGSRRIFPLFIFLIIFEIFKWCIHVIYKQDYDTIWRKNIFVTLYDGMNFADMIRSSAITFICCIAIYIIAVLFGAQVLENQEETLMFSLLMTVLTVLPLSIHFGSYCVEEFIQRVPPSDVLNSLIYSNSQFSVIGAWFGAFVIPLDWDRPWQVWPIPCSLGALTGCCISNYIHIIKMTVPYLRTRCKRQ